MEKQEFLRKMEEPIYKAFLSRKEKRFKSKSSSSWSTGKLPGWSKKEIANVISEQYKSVLAWDATQRQWLRYGGKSNGIWSFEYQEKVIQLVKAEIRSAVDRVEERIGGRLSLGYSYNFLIGIISLLKKDLIWNKEDLSSKESNQLDGLVPLLNGVLDLKTKKLRPLSDKYRSTWSLLFEYDPQARCEPIKQWLLQICQGDEALLEIIRAFFLGVLTSRGDWQRYLELVGLIGTGKSTFVKLARALVSDENVHETTLKKLEKSKYETANLIGKKLCVLRQGDLYKGEISVLKQITECQEVYYQEKSKQSTSSFVFEGMVIVIADEPIESTEYISKTDETRICLEMKKRIKPSQQRSLLEFRGDCFGGEFAPYIPGFLNWVLEMDEEYATELMKNPLSNSPTLTKMKIENLLYSNPIADWLDNNVVIADGVNTNVGGLKKDLDLSSDNDYLNTERWLYPNYAQYCNDIGIRPVALKRFSNLLLDLCHKQLGLPVEKGRNREGSYFEGLRIRTDGEDDYPMPITELFYENISGKNTKNKVFPDTGVSAIDL